MPLTIEPRRRFEVPKYTCEKCRRPTELAIVGAREDNGEIIDQQPLCIGCIEKVLRESVATYVTENHLEIPPSEAFSLASTCLLHEIYAALAINLTYATIRIMRTPVYGMTNRVMPDGFVVVGQGLLTQQWVSSHLMHHRSCDELIHSAFYYLSHLFHDSTYPEIFLPDEKK